MRHWGTDEAVDQTDETLAVEESSAGSGTSGLRELEHDNLGENKAVEGNTFGDIQTAIYNSNPGDTIILSGLYTGSGTPIDVFKDNLTFIGENDATLDANGLSGILNIQGYHITIKNISFINANKNDYDGGAIRWEADGGTVSGCSFVNNYAIAAGAIEFYGGVNCTVSDCSFENNSAYNTAGAIAFYFSDNARVFNCSFVNNNASTMYAGATALIGHNGNVSGCSFVNNTEELGGGAILVVGENNTVSDCSFAGNNASSAGGAILWFEDPNEAPIASSNGVLSNCTFENNNATTGGAIKWDGANGTVYDCSFVGNTAVDDGGAIRWTGADGTVSNCTFERNRATNSNADGGAIYWYEGATNGTVSNCTFEDNTAKQYGGAIYWNAANGTVSDCTFENNHALNSDGGAIRWGGGYGNISDCSFVNNTAATEGGAIRLWSSNDTVSNCSFVNNTARVGGAIHIWSSNDIISNCSFVNNNAIELGGAIHSYDNITVCDSRFVNNTAVLGGAAVTFDSSSSTIVENCTGIISNCSFVNNTATGDFGGAAILTVMKLNISDSVFIDNKCASLSLLFSNNTLTFTGLQNYINAINSYYDSSEHYGGEVFIVNSDIIFDNVTFWNGDVVNSDDVKPNKSNQEAGINITVEFYDSTGAFVKNVTHMTNASGQLLLDYSGLKTGDYTVKAYHIEDAYYTYIETTGSFSVKNYYIVVLNNRTLYYTETPVTVRLIATVEDSESRDLVNPDNVKLVFVLSNGTEIEARCLDGVWVAEWTFDKPGNYTVTAKLNETEFKIGDDYYTLADTLNGTVSIAKNSTYDIGIAVDNVTYPDSAVINVTVPSDVTGNVTVNINGTEYPTVKVNDTTYQAVVPLEPGVYTVNATVSNDPKYADKTSDNKEFTVEATAHIEAEDMKRGWDSPYDYLAKLVDAKGNPVSGQTLIFTVNGKEYEAVTDSEGVAKLTTSKLAVGVYDVTVTNPATGENVTKKVTIVKRLLQNKDVTKDFEGPQGYTVLAIGDDGNPVGAGQIVVMKVNGVTYNVKTDNNGYATLPIHLNPKSYVITATYHKTTVKNKITVKQTLKLVLKTVSVVKGKNLVLRATLKWTNGKAIVGKVIKFNFKNKIYTAKTNKNGLATVTISAKITNTLKKGATYKYAAAYIKNIVKGVVKIK